MKFKYYLGLVAAVVVGFAGGYALCAWNNDFYDPYFDDDDFDEDCTSGADGDGFADDRHYTDLNPGSGAKATGAGETEAATTET